MQSILLVRWRRRRNNLHPAARTPFHVRIVTLWIPAVIPVIRLLWLRGRLDVFVRLQRFRIVRVIGVGVVRIIIRVVRIIIRVGIGIPTPPPRAKPDTSTEMSTMSVMSVMSVMSPKSAMSVMSVMSPKSVMSAVSLVSHRRVDRVDGIGVPRQGDHQDQCHSRKCNRNGFFHLLPHYVEVF